jgi:hypothetical protein
MYFILLLKLGWMVSGYHRKMYMTSAQLILAKTGQAPAWIFCRAEAERKGWAGFTRLDGEFGEGEHDASEDVDYDLGVIR